MRTRTQNEVKTFKEAIDKCRMPVLLVSPDGTQYNMKAEADYAAGIEKWIADRNDEMEIFTCALEDEAVMMNFCLKMAA